MAKKKDLEIKDASAEDKIKNAARKIFLQKGFSGTRTRDIAEEAGMNLALLNYYFRSKEKLFNIIMLETMQNFMRAVSVVFKAEELSLHQKIEAIVLRYIDFLNEQPELPLFLLSELRSNPEGLLEKLEFKAMLMESHLMQQYFQALAEEKIAPISVFHFIMNLMGLVAFPFIASPIIKNLGGMEKEDFRELMEERKKLVPQWLTAMLKPV